MSTNKKAGRTTAAGKGKARRKESAPRNGFERAAAAPIEPEVVGTEPAAPTGAEVGFLRRESDAMGLQALEMMLTRDWEDARKAEQASAFLSIRMGLALEAGKTIIRHGAYEDWVAAKFPFGVRHAQYMTKLAKVFLSEAAGRVELPPVSDRGAWLVRADDRSALSKAVGDFVGQRTLPELYAAYSIKPKAASGGFRPSAIMVARYQGQHKELAGLPFEQWTREQQEAFKAWQQQEVDAGGEAEAHRMAAESTWAGLREKLMEHGLKRKSYAYISRAQIEETRDVLALVSKELGKALKERTDA